MAGNANSGRKSVRLEKEITPRERVFVAEYLKDMSGPHAAVRAGYPDGSAGSRLLLVPRVKREVERLVAVRSERTGITAERVLQELGNLAFSNPADLFHPDGSLKAWNELTADQAKLIGSVKTRRTVELGKDGKPQPVELVEYAFVSKLAALTLTMRHLGLFNDHLSIEVSSLADRMYAAQQRLLERSPQKVIEGAAVEVEPEDETLLVVEDLI